MILNEQVIINNVEVSKCPYLQKREDEYKCELFYNENCCCEIRDNCYYKQLKIKEQEIEELKNKIEFMEEYIKTIENARDEFERENKFLKLTERNNNK